jgi:hypothetical protein
MAERAASRAAAHVRSWDNKQRTWQVKGTAPHFPNSSRGARTLLPRGPDVLDRASAIA